MERVAAVIVFDDETSEAEAQRILNRISEIVSLDVRVYNEEYGDPVFYIP